MTEQINKNSQKQTNKKRQCAYVRLLTWFIGLPSIDPALRLVIITACNEEDFSEEVCMRACVRSCVFMSASPLSANKSRGHTGTQH